MGYPHGHGNIHVVQYLQWSFRQAADPGAACRQRGSSAALAEASPGSPPLRLSINHQTWIQPPEGALNLGGILNGNLDFYPNLCRFQQQIFPERQHLEYDKLHGKHFQDTKPSLSPG